METNSEYISRKKSMLTPLLAVILLLFFVNFCIVDYWIYTNPHSQSSSIPIATDSPSPTVAVSQCDEVCVRAIVKQATASTSFVSPSSTAKSLVKPRVTASPTAAPSQPKDLYVSIGSGKTAAGDWVDVEGLQVNFNAGQYGSVKSIIFEATLSVPSSNGIAYARLYNVTDGSVVANSDVTSTSASPQLVSSQPIALEGAKVYKVQMKSSLMHDAVLTQSRIKITLN